MGYAKHIIEPSMVGLSQTRFTGWGSYMKGELNAGDFVMECSEQFPDIKRCWH